MIPNWPTDLPRPMRQGYQSSPMEARLKRRAEAGFPGYRRRFSSVAEIVMLTLDVSRNERAIFDKFHRETSKFGSKTFYMPDPTTDGWALLTSEGGQLLASNGAPLLLSARWLCMFGDTQPATTVVGVRFRIAFDVAVMP